MKPAPIYLLIEGETDGPHAPAEIIDRFSPIDEDENSKKTLSENTLACIEGMKGWRILSETLIYSYAKILPALPLAEEWICQAASGTLNLRDGKAEIRKTINRTIGLDDWNAPDYLWQAIETNYNLLRCHREYLNGEQMWNKEVLDFYPLMEFVPFDKSSLPRWLETWQMAGKSCFQNRMIARKDDPCWKNFSDFDVPLAPFSFGRDGLLQSVSILEAQQIGFVFDTSPIRLPELPPFKIIGL